MTAHPHADNLRKRTAREFAACERLLETAVVLTPGRTFGGRWPANSRYVCVTHKQYETLRKFNKVHADVEPVEWIARKRKTHVFARVVEGT